MSQIVRVTDGQVRVDLSHTGQWVVWDEGRIERQLAWFARNGASDTVFAGELTAALRQVRVEDVDTDLAQRKLEDQP